MSSPTLSPLHRLSALGQSVWVDFLSRESIHGGHLQELLDRDAVVGATSNPSIFQKAMTANGAYDEQLHQLAAEGITGKELFWRLATRDIKDACDLFRPIWEAGCGRDGYVSLEVDPGLAYDGPTTFREAMRLHELVDRPNLMVKIPATKPGLAAIEDVIAKGRSVNITLIFSLRRYAEVAESYVRGLERLIAEGGDPSGVASVASFFVSRIDTEADRRLDELTPEARGAQTARGPTRRAEGPPGDRQREARLPALQVGLPPAPLGVPREQGRHAPARAVGQHLHEEPRLPRHSLHRGADRPRHREHVPEETIAAYQDHGRPQMRLEEGLADAKRLIEQLASVRRGLRRRNRDARARGRGEVLRGLRCAPECARSEALRIVCSLSTCPRSSSAAPRAALGAPPRCASRARAGMCSQACARLRRASRSWPRRAARARAWSP